MGRNGGWSMSTKILIQGDFDAKLEGTFNPKQDTERKRGKKQKVYGEKGTGTLSGEATAQGAEDRAKLKYKCTLYEDRCINTVERKRCSDRD